jgi:phenylacetic acid degradation operon negative regulatory protein
MRKQLAWLGFGQLASGTYLAPRDLTSHVRQLAERLGAGAFAKTFIAHGSGLTDDAHIVRQCWDMPRIARAYARFVRHYAPLYARDLHRYTQSKLDDADAFRMRFALTHDFRRFPFLDPDLPKQLLPPAWPGTRARKLFEEYHALLTDGALRFFSACAAGSSG